MAYPFDVTLQVIAPAVLSAAGFGAAVVTTHSELIVGVAHSVAGVVLLLAR